LLDNKYFRQKLWNVNRLDNKIDIAHHLLAHQKFM
jgi:hypothetical protein